MTQPPDLGRRGFFRVFAKDIAQAAGAALEMTSTLNRAASEAAGSILRASPGEGPLAAEVPVAGVSDQTVELEPGAMTAVQATVGVERAPSAPSRLLRPFRVEDDLLFVVDENRLPDAVVEIECRSPIDLAREIDRRALPGGSVPGQAAAMSLALAASQMRGYLPTVRTAIMRIRADGLVNARPSSHSLRRAVARVMTVYEAAAEINPDGAAIAAAVREEADAICREAQVAVGLIGERLVSMLPEVGARPVVLLADATAVPFLAAGARTRSLTVHVTEGGPERRGARIGAGLLARAEIDHAVIADAAAGWLLGMRRIDAVVVGAERIAANGDTISEIGTYPLAVLAERHHVPFVVCGAAAALDPASADGVTATGSDREGPAPADGTAWRPAPRDEIVPHDLIASIVTERDVLWPPLTAALTQAR